MIRKLVGKLKEFLLLWLLYLIFLTIVATASIFLIVPFVVLIKTGALVFLPEVDLVVTIGRGVIGSSLVLALVMYAWEQWRYAAALRAKGEQ